MRSGWRARRDLAPGAAHRRVVALDDGSILNRYWDDSDAPRDESYREDVALARATPRPPQADLARDPRRRRERLGFQLALVRRRANARHDRHDRDHSGRSQQPAVRPRERDRAPAASARAITTAPPISPAAPPPAAPRSIATSGTRRAASISTIAGRRSSASTRVSAATLYPLFAGAASGEQAASVAAAVEKDLLEARRHRRDAASTPASNGTRRTDGRRLQWIARRGLERATATTALAEQIACRWMVNVERVYRQTGKLVEKYDVIATERPGGGGEYPTAGRLRLDQRRHRAS